MNPEDLPSGLPPPPELDPASLLADAISAGEELVSRAEGLLTAFWRPWTLYQALIVLALLVAAELLRAGLAPRIREWMAARHGWPKWRLRVLAVIHQRLRAIFFVALVWSVWAYMQNTTWPSRSFLVGVVAELALAWLVVVFATRLIRAPFLRQAVRWGAWTYVTLSILGLVTEAALVLDRIAVSFGEFRLSLLLVVKAVAWLAATIALARFLTSAVAGRIRANPDLSPSMQVLAVKILQIFLYGAALLFAIRAVGVDLTGLAVLSGAIGIGLGFGLQKVVSNLVSGVIILLDKSIKPGDVISIGDTFGWIMSLGARYVSITTRDGREYLIPNEDLITGQVVNWSHSDDFVRLDIFFGTSYGDDPHKVRAIATEAAAAVPRVLAGQKPVCHITGFGDSSVDYILRFWISDPTDGLTNIRGNVYLALWDAFQTHGISIPFPQREVKVLDGAPGRPMRSDLPERLRKDAG